MQGAPSPSPAGRWTEADAAWVQVAPSAKACKMAAVRVVPVSRLLCSTTCSLAHKKYSNRNSSFSQCTEGQSEWKLPTIPSATNMLRSTDDLLGPAPQAPIESQSNRILSSDLSIALFSVVTESVLVKVLMIEKIKSLPE